MPVCMYVHLKKGTREKKIADYIQDFINEHDNYEFINRILFH